MTQNNLITWLLERRISTSLQVIVSLALTFAFAIPLSAILLALQDPSGLPAWVAVFVSINAHQTISYSALPLILLALLGMWIATSGVTERFRAALIAREITNLSKRITNSLGESPDGNRVRKEKQRLNIERQLIDSHYSLAVSVARTTVFFTVTLFVVPLTLALAVTCAQAYLLNSAISRFHIGSGLFERFASIHSRSNGKVGNSKIVEEFGGWLADLERTVSALPFRDYLVTAVIIIAGIGGQLLFGVPVENWAHGVPAVGVWASMAFDVSRALAHYGFSVARWGAASSQEVY